MTDGPRHPVRLFARLKLRLLANAFKIGGARSFSILLGWIFAVVIGLTGTLVGVAMRSVHNPDSQAAGVTVFFVGFAIAALLAPALFFGIDDAIGPDRLAHYPLSRRARVAGLAVASAIGAPALALALALTGFVIGVTDRVVGLPLVVLAAAGQFWLCVVGSRVPATLLARAVNSRRGRDVAAVLGAFVGFSGFLVQFLARRVNATSDTLRHIADLLRWTPFGAFGHAMVDAGRGRVSVTLAGLGVGAAGIAVLVWMWSIALDRLLEQTAGAGTDDGHVVSPPAPLFAGWLSWLPRTARGAVSARELRAYGRDPRRRVTIISALVLGIVIPLVNDVASSVDRSATVLFAAGSSGIVVFATMNQFGVDGRALWFDLLSGVPVRTLLVGKNIATVILAAPVVAIAAVILAGVTHGWAYVPASVVVGTAVVCVGLGVANIVSVLAPIPVPEGPNPFASKDNGRGCISGLLLFGAMGVLSALVAPMAVLLLVFRDHALTCLVIGLVSLPYGIALWWVGLAMADRRLRGREPELLALVDPR
jgi:ABC-2 type transport system permease protein